MEPPAWVCKKLAGFHSQLRIGWSVRENKFGLVQLYHKRDASRTVRELWEDPREYRGPIYSKSGRPCSDWDNLSRVPIYLTPLEHNDVFSGKVVWLVRSRWSRPIAARVHEAAMDEGRRIEGQIQDYGHEMASDVYRKGQRDGSGAPIIAKKFIKPTPNQIKSREGKLDFSESLLPPSPPGGWEKHLENDKGDDTSIE